LANKFKVSRNERGEQELNTKPFAVIKLIIFSYIGAVGRPYDYIGIILKNVENSEEKHLFLVIYSCFYYIRVSKLVQLFGAL
jgi:hypothetical protein